MDVEDNQEEYGTDGAADAFLSRWKDSEETSKDDDGANSQEQEETTAQDEEIAEQEEEVENDEEGSEEDQEDSNDEDGKTEDKFVEDDNLKVKYTVDGVEHTVSVKDLKKYAGQEASLTRKSQEVAEVRKVAEENAKVHLVGLQKMLERAETKAKEFANIDFNLAAKNLPQEDYLAVREAAEKAFADVKFYTEELGGVMESLEKQRISDYQKNAAECIKALSDPETGIKGWSQETYNTLKDYAVSLGMPAEAYSDITNPVFFKILHKAHQFDSIKKVSAQKKATAPKKVLKSKGALPSKKSTAQSLSAMNVLKQRGDVESAANAFMARWDAKGSDD